MEVLNAVKVKVQVKVVPYLLMWRPFPLFPIISFFLHREKYGSHQKFSVVSRCVFRGEGMTLFFLVLFGCLLHKWSRLFVFFFDLTIDGMGWDRSCA